MNGRTDFLDALTRRWPFVLAMPVLAIAAAALVSYVTTPTYEATASIALAPSTLSVPTANQVPPYYLMVDSARRLPVSNTPAYYMALVKSADDTSGSMTLANAVFSVDSGDKSLLNITVRDADAKLAAQSATRFAELGAVRIQQILIPSADEANTAKNNLATAEQALARFGQDNGLGSYDLAKFRSAGGLPTDKALELAGMLRARDTAEAVYLDLARDLSTETILAGGAYKPAVMAAAIPTAPISPKLGQNLLFGAGFGILVGVLGALALESAARK